MGNLCVSLLGIHILMNKERKNRFLLVKSKHFKKCSCHTKGNNENMLVILKVRKNNVYLTNLQCMMIYA